MGASVRVSSEAGLQALGIRLAGSREHARAALRQIVDAPDPLARLKFERIGCDPLDVKDPQNLAEQIDQQATYEAAASALRSLMQRHAGKVWDFAPGAHGSGHDIASTDGTVAAEVFAAVDPKNNKKLSKDIQKVSKSTAQHRYVFFRSPSVAASERTEAGVIVVALPAQASSK